MPPSTTCLLIRGGRRLDAATRSAPLTELLLTGGVITQLGAVEMLQQGCTTCDDLTFGFPLVTVDELIAIGQAYVNAGMRAVVAPMLQDISFYQAIPGLYDALPEHLRQQLDAGPGDTGFILRQMEEAAP